MFKVSSKVRWIRAAITAAISASVLMPGVAATAADYVPVNGAGSSWSANAVDQWRRNVKQYGLSINYASTGSSDGRNQFKAGTVDFAVTEIPYGLKDGGVVDVPPSRGFAYMPIVAGGTSFMYNLKVGGKRFTNLRLSGENVTKIFTGVITSWDDKSIAADNPGVKLPARKIVPVVRSDGSGSTAQFSTWMAAEHSKLWDAWCKKAGRSTPCGVTSNYPVVSGKGFVSQPNSQGVSGYVAQNANEGTITYVEYSYALKTGFPVAKILNSAGYYVAPTASNVAVGLLGAKINTTKGDNYLTQILTGVYNNKDPRAYPLSSYSYLVIPTEVVGSFTAKKGTTLSEFAKYFLCEGQQQAEVLGYSPLPINLVKAGLEQVKKIPGVVAENIDVTKCNNPTFSKDGTNTLAKNAPMPAASDKFGYVASSGSTGVGAGTGATDAGTGAGTTDSGTGTGTTDAGTGAGTTDAGTGTGAGTLGPAYCDPDTGACSSIVADAITPPNANAMNFDLVKIVMAAALFIGLIVTPGAIVVIRKRFKN